MRKIIYILTTSVLLFSCSLFRETVMSTDMDLLKATTPDWGCDDRNLNRLYMYSNSWLPNQ